MTKEFKSRPTDEMSFHQFVVTPVTYCCNYVEAWVRRVPFLALGQQSNSIYNDTRPHYFQREIKIQSKKVNKFPIPPSRYFCLRH